MEKFFEHCAESLSFRKRIFEPDASLCRRGSTDIRVCAVVESPDAAHPLGG
jgi:hypothetical protein